MLAGLKKLLCTLIGPKAPVAVSEPESEPVELCCQGRVHIAYRGLADDRLYMAYDRAFAEVKFFKPNGLRVFCAGCRRHLY